MRKTGMLVGENPIKSASALLNVLYRFADIPQELQEENGIQYRFEVYESVEP